MRHMWVVALMGDDATNERFGKPAYALGVLRRMVPPGRPFEKGEIMDYIESLRAALGKAADRHPLYRNGKPKNGLSAASPVISWRVEKEEELFPGVKELRGVMTFQDRLAASVNNKVVYTNVARLDVEVVQTFICSGGHWYPYEVASPIRQVGVGETENAKG